MHVNNSAVFIDENPKLSPCGMGENRHAGNRKDLRGYFIMPQLDRGDPFIAKAAVGFLALMV